MGESPRICPILQNNEIGSFGASSPLIFRNGQIPEVGGQVVRWSLVNYQCRGVL